MDKQTCLLHYNRFAKNMQTAFRAGLVILCSALLSVACNSATTPEPLVIRCDLSHLMDPVMLDIMPPEEIPVRFPLNNVQRDLVERIVMAEAGGEDYDGQRLVAQCILNACERDGISPEEAVREYQYTRPATYASQSCCDAVAAVFDRGELVTAEPVLFFYAPRWIYSAWHESQVFVLEHGGHRFFKEVIAK